MNKIFATLATLTLIASATSAAAGGSTKGSGGYNGVTLTGLTAQCRGGSTKGTGGLNGVSRSGLAAAVRPLQASMKVLSVSLPTKLETAGH